MNNIDFSDDESSSESDDGNNPFDNLDEQSLNITSFSVEDLFHGMGGKQIFCRVEGQDHIRMLFPEEIYIYLNYHIREYLTELVNTSER